MNEWVRLSLAARLRCRFRLARTAETAFSAAGLGQS